MIELQGIEYDVGSIVVFDFGRYCEIGVITEIYTSEDQTWCSIVEPSGRRRERCLEHDAAKHKLARLNPSQSTFLTTNTWLKRSNTYE